MTRRHPNYPAARLNATYLGALAYGALILAGAMSVGTWTVREFDGAPVTIALMAVGLLLGAGLVVASCKHAIPTGRAAKRTCVPRDDYHWATQAPAPYPYRLLLAHMVVALVVAGTSGRVPLGVSVILLVAMHVSAAYLIRHSANGLHELHALIGPRLTRQAILKRASWYARNGHKLKPLPTERYVYMPHARIEQTPGVDANGNPRFQITAAPEHEGDAAVYVQLGPERDKEPAAAARPADDGTTLRTDIQGRREFTVDIQQFDAGALRTLFGIPDDVPLTDDDLPPERRTPADRPARADDFDHGTQAVRTKYLSALQRTASTIADSLAPEAPEHDDSPAVDPQPAPQSAVYVAPVGTPPNAVRGVLSIKPDRRLSLRGWLLRRRIRRQWRDARDWQPVGYMEHLQLDDGTTVPLPPNCTYQDTTNTLKTLQETADA